ncbi:MAG: protein translocase SEC61 complex subunit gamma [Candidatus Altiarchaeota archaeon]|nr:protein translocase SEC61 complex subunit gamma [Candidatus Altiarchaeota archaeon]
MKVIDKIKRMFSETRRILILTRRPKRSEYNETIKVTGAGILLMGALGFIVLFISRIA